MFIKMQQRLFTQQAKQQNVCNGRLLKIILVQQNFALPVEAILCKDNRGRWDTKQKVLFCHYTDPNKKVPWIHFDPIFVFVSLFLRFSVKTWEHLQWHTELYISTFWLKFINHNIFSYFMTVLFSSLFLNFTNQSWQSSKIHNSI